MIKEKALEKLQDIIETWSEFGNSHYKLISRLGKDIEKILPYLPEKIKQSPSNTLYRFVEISLPLLKKVQRNEKYAILRNRKYSSWSYSLDAVKEFGDTSGSHVERYAGVILKRNFSNDQMLLNLPECFNFLPELDSTNKWEKEIIVKNASKDFKFVAKDIYLVMRYDILRPHKWQTLKSAFSKL